MNLLQNPNFDQGHHHQDNVTGLVVPDGWRIVWLDNAPFPGASGPAQQPESMVWNNEDAPDNEKVRFLLQGDSCWRVFRARAPLYFAVTQNVTGLIPEARYRFTARIFPDIVEKATPYGKVRPKDIWAAEARAGWSLPHTPWSRGRAGGIFWAPWFNIHSGNFAYGRFNDIRVEFTAPEDGAIQVWAEAKAKWGILNAWFLDAFSLVRIDNAPSPEPPSKPQPEPQPTSARGAPRSPYERTYILLPSNCPVNWVTAAARTALTFQATMGFSADDAGIGDLDARTIIAVNPHDIGTGLSAAWYAEHYPGVRYIAIEANTASELEQRLYNLLSGQ